MTSSARSRIERRISIEIIRSPLIDHELESGRLLDRQIGRIGSLQDPAGVDAGLAIVVGDDVAVADQAAGTTNSRNS
jgi:hypothetical protein